MAKVGRPTDEPKTRTIIIKLSDNERGMLDFLSKVSGKSRSEVVRILLKKAYAEISEIASEEFNILNELEERENAAMETIKKEWEKKNEI